MVGFNGTPDVPLFKSYGGAVESVNPDLDYLSGYLPSGRITPLSQEPQVAYVEPDQVVTLTSRSASPRGAPAQSTQTTPWGIIHIGTPWTWPFSDGSYIDPGDGSTVRVRVAVCDTGVDVNHPDLVGQAVFGINFTTDPDGDVYGHGTHVTGTVAAADNAIGVIGTAHGSQVVDVKVLDDTGSGFWSWVADGINWAADPSQGNCQVISLSLGGYSGSNTLRSAVKNAWNDGAVLAAAAGNDAVTFRHYPSSYSQCLSVAASDYDDTNFVDTWAGFSNYGRWVDISAPGVNILSTTGGDYEYWAGTSMATPHVAGVAALVWAKFPTQTNQYIRDRLENTKGQDIGPPPPIPGLVYPYRAVTYPP